LDEQQDCYGSTNKQREKTISMVDIFKDDLVSSMAKSLKRSGPAALPAYSKTSEGDSPQAHFFQTSLVY